MGWIAALIAVGGSLLADQMEGEPPSVGAMSAEERELLALQTSLLRDMQRSAQSGQELNQLLMPLMLEEAGFTIQRADKNVVNKDYTKARERYEKIHDYVMANERYFARDQSSGNLRLSREGRGESDHGFGDSLKAAMGPLIGDPRAPKTVLDDTKLSAADLKKITGGKTGVPAMQAIVDEYNRAKAELKTVDRYSQRRGDIIGLERAPLSEADQLREGIEMQLLQRQDAALRGELPVNPALLSELGDQEEELRASLLENLGTGYETSTPGIEALAEFGERKSNILEMARRDDISGAQQLSTQMGQFINGLNASDADAVQRVLGNQFGTSQAYGAASNMFASPLSYLQQNRGLEAGFFTQNNYPGATQSLLTQGSSAASTYALAQLFNS